MTVNRDNSPVVEMEAVERSNKPSRRVTFEIDEDTEFRQLIGRDEHRVTPKSPKSVGARLCLYVSFITIAALLVGALLGTSGDSLKEGAEDIELRGSAATRVNATSTVPGSTLLTSLQDDSLSLEEKLDCLSSSDSKDDRVVSLYSLEAKKKLVEKLKRDKNFTLLVNGGSTTAAAGHIFDNELFFVRFARYLEALYSTAVTVVNMGHGARDSFHSFLMAESFFPPTKVDLIVWEFSINDRLVGEATAAESARLLAL
jgi:hypothetical protein